jgi:hypothetical protein
MDINIDVDMDKYMNMKMDMATNKINCISPRRTEINKRGKNELWSCIIMVNFEESLTVYC